MDDRTISKWCTSFQTVTGQVCDNSAVDFILMCNAG